MNRVLSLVVTVVIMIAIIPIDVIVLARESYINQGITNERLIEMINNDEISKSTTDLFIFDVEGELTDLTPLNELKDLTTLILINAKVSELMPLSRMNLVNLVLDSNQISDITPLADLIRLRGLSLRDNQISDITPLNDLTNLGTLWLSNNQITDLTPLYCLIWMWELDITDNPITLQQVRSLQSVLPDCHILHNAVCELCTRGEDDCVCKPVDFIFAYVRKHPDSAMGIAVDMLKFVVELEINEAFNFEPTIGDAVEILKFVVGLESLVDDG